MALTIYNAISIVELIFYFPALAVAVLLLMRHSFRRSAGWVYLAILSLMRVIGGAMQLATIQQPTNTSLVTGSQILLNVGLSPLILVLLGLVTRAYQSLPERSRPALPNTRLLRLLQVAVVVGLILVIVGGINAGDQVSDDLHAGRPLVYTVQTESKAGVVLMTVAYALLVLSALAIAACLGAMPTGEKRLLLAVGAALPFVLVRIAYALLSIFDSKNPHFRQFGGDNTNGYIVLGMCTIMEIICVVIFETVGLTLGPQPAAGPPYRGNHPLQQHRYPKPNEAV